MQRLRRWASGQRFHENQWQWRYKREGGLRVRGLHRADGEYRVKESWVDILICRGEVERREIHFYFSSGVTMWKTKTQLRPIGRISRGNRQMLLPALLFPSKNKWWRLDRDCPLGIDHTFGHVPGNKRTRISLDHKLHEIRNFSCFASLFPCLWQCWHFTSFP